MVNQKDKIILFTKETKRGRQFVGLFCYTKNLSPIFTDINLFALVRLILFSFFLGLISPAFSQVLNPYNIVGGGPFCQGTTGSRIWLDGSDSGITYELVYNDTISVLSNLPGTGDSLYFGRYATNGFYTIVAHDTLLGLFDTMVGQVTINMVNKPNVFNISGGGNICENDNGSSIFLSGSQNSVLYDLFLNDTILMSTYGGNGTSLFLGNFDLAGIYTVIGRNATLPTCPNDMNGNAIIQVFQPPTPLPLQGNGTFCQGSAGATLFLFPSENNSNYTLYNSSNVAISSAIGNGDTLFFNPVSSSSIYSAIGSRTEVSGCSSIMIGTISVSPLNQSIYTVSGGGIICENGSGGVLILSGSQQGFDYYWENGILDSSSSPIPGTGGALTFDSLALEGTFNIWSLQHSTPNCLASMAGTATIQIQELPTPFNLTGGGYYCEGQEGVAIGLAGSELGVQYQLYLNQNIPTSFSQIGTGDSLLFGIATLSGNYSVLASINGCQSEFQTNVDVAITDCTKLEYISEGEKENPILFLFEKTIFFKNRIEHLEIIDGTGKLIYLGNNVQQIDVTTFGSGIFVAKSTQNLPFKFIIP